MGRGGSPKIYFVRWYSTKNETNRKVASYYTSKYKSGHFGLGGHVTLLNAAGRVVLSQRLTTHTLMFAFHTYTWNIDFIMFESHTHLLDKQINKYLPNRQLPFKKHIRHLDYHE